MIMCDVIHDTFRHVFWRRLDFAHKERPTRYVGQITSHNKPHVVTKNPLIMKANTVGNIIGNITST